VRDRSTLTSSSIGNGEYKFVRLFKAIRMLDFCLFFSFFVSYILFSNILPHGYVVAIIRIFTYVTYKEGIEFQGVALPDEPIPPPNNNAPFANVPVFLGPDGTLYDVNCIMFSFHYILAYFLIIGDI
jgi:hypothetical protein